MSVPDRSPTPAARRPRRWRLSLGAGVLIVAGAALVVFARADVIIAERLRAATIELLEQRFDSSVELARLDVRAFPILSVRGEGLVLRHRTRAEIPPVISLKTFTIEGSVRELWTRHIDRVRIEGLQIAIPPRRGEDMPRLPPRADAGGKPDVIIHELVADHGLLTIASKRAGRPPRAFTLSHLRFEDLQFGKATAFEASLSNPIPAGIINAVGQFGPWNGEEPSLTPVTGSFRFDADLGTIEGIGGEMRAEGSFSGPLERIVTSGRAHMPRFRLSSGGAEFPLTVDYKAVVDGTSGDTLLDTVEADLGKSHISASGAVVRVEGVHGRRVKLTTRARKGRIEDFIRLTTRVASSPMVGAVDVDARLDIPPGKGEVLDRMDLDGTFALAAVRFTSKAIQDRIDELSRRGQGRPKDEEIDDVASNMRGAFKLDGGRMTVRSLTFRVEGAEVRLAGSYDSRSEQLDFRGTLRLQASVSQTQTGWKSIVLKVFDPLFRRDGAGTVLPITITGTRDQPKFGVDLKKAILRR